MVTKRNPKCLGAQAAQSVLGQPGLTRDPVSNKTQQGLLMAQGVKVLATKSNDLSSNPGTHLVEGENHVLVVVVLRQGFSVVLVILEQTL